VPKPAACVIVFVITYRSGAVAMVRPPSALDGRLRVKLGDVGAYDTAECELRLKPSRT